MGMEGTYIVVAIVCVGVGMLVVVMQYALTMVVVWVKVALHNTRCTCIPTPPVL